MSQTPLFAYSELDAETSRVIQQRTDEIKALMRQAAEDVITIGRKLAEVRERLGHGRFLDWLDAEFGWHRSTAYRFMQVADAFSTVEISQFEKFAPSALYLLAAPSAPETARAEALERAMAGEAITYSQARTIVARHQAFPLTDGDPAGAAEGATALWSEQEETSVDISEIIADESAAIPNLPTVPDDTAMLEDLVVGVEGWLAGRSALAEARAMILAEIAARSTVGLDHLNALLTSGVLPAPFRNRDVLAACKVVQASLPADGQASGDGGQESGDTPKVRTAGGQEAASADEVTGALTSKPAVALAEPGQS